MSGTHWHDMTETAPIAPAGPRARQNAAARHEAAAARQPPAEGDRAALVAEMNACRRCPLWKNATQAVPGEGPRDAALMVVGEQPGDQEDLSGHPFVGPAGRLFDEVAERAGLDRSRLYLTNAVKHFKFVPRGKRRIHQAPNGGEIRQCRWWLDLERRMVRPKLILAMGATALESLTGNRRGLLKRRGRIETAADGTPVLVTVHPSYLLRVPREDRAAAEALFEADLRRAAERVG